MAHRILKAISASCLSALLLAGSGCDSGGPNDVAPPTTPEVVSPPTSVPEIQPATPAALSGSTTRPTDPLLATPSYLFFKEVPDPRKSQADPNGQEAETNPSDFGAPHEFPRARLKLSGKGGHNVVAILYSDDPPAALKTAWAGDRFYFRMPLQIVDREAIDGYPYRMSIPLDGSDETSNGVFIRGDQEHLEPIDLTVRFERQGSRVVMYVGGLFRQYDAANPQAEPKWYHVRGIIQAVAE